MEENVGKKIEEEIEEMTKNLREKIQDAQTREIKRKNWKYWQPIRGINIFVQKSCFEQVALSQSVSHPEGDRFSHASLRTRFPLRLQSRFSASL